MFLCKYLRKIHVKVTKDTQRLHKRYAKTTQKIRKDYTKDTQRLHKRYAKTTQKIYKTHSFGAGLCVLVHMLGGLNGTDKGSCYYSRG